MCPWSCSSSFFTCLPATQTHTCTSLFSAISNKRIPFSDSAIYTQTGPNPHTHTSSILSPVRRVPLCAAGLSGLMCLMKIPLIISPLLSLLPMPLPPIMLIPRDWPGARVSCTLKHIAEYKEHPHVVKLQILLTTHTAVINSFLLYV